MKIIAPILIVILLVGCKNANIFQEKRWFNKDKPEFELLTNNYEHVLRPDDKVSVSIWNHDDLSVGSVFSIFNTNESYGKWLLIESDSSLAIPYVNSIKVAGLTLSEAEAYVAEKLSEFVKDPVVELRVLNREVTILGEVNAPGNYLLEKERNTLVEYLGKAQGLNFYADSDRIKVIRNDVSYEINLTQFADFDYKNIYLQAHDIIYIPSKKGKKLDMKAPILIPFASLLTSIGVVISVITK